MNRFKLIATNLVEEESGQDLIEYALVAALVGLGAIASLKYVAIAITHAFTDVAIQLYQNT